MGLVSPGLVRGEAEWVLDCVTLGRAPLSFMVGRQTLLNPGITTVASPTECSATSCGRSQNPTFLLVLRDCVFPFIWGLGGVRGWDPEEVPSQVRSHTCLRCGGNGTASLEVCCQMPVVGMAATYRFPRRVPWESRWCGEFRRISHTLSCSGEVTDGEDLPQEKNMAEALEIC